MLKQRKNEERSEERPAASLHLRRKGVILGATFLLLIALIVAGTTAWYTRIANISGMTLDIAKFDVKANYTDDHFIINVNDYLNVMKDKAAPGTGGVIPVLVSSGSDTEAEYSITLNLKTIAPEFLQRIRFYYYTPGEGPNAPPVRHELGGDRYVYEKNGNKWKRSDQKDDPTLANAIKGTLGMNEGKNQCYEFIYWEWVYSLEKDEAYDLATGKWGPYAAETPVPGKPEKPAEPQEADYPEQPEEYEAALAAYQTEMETYPEELAAYQTALAAHNAEEAAFSEAAKAHDALDTALGVGDYDAEFESAIDPASEFKTVGSEDGGVKAYQNAMLIKLSVIGAQAAPERNLKPAECAESAAAGKGTTIYVENG